MEPSEVKELKLGTPVWVWIVRFGTGRWWPGTVEGIETIVCLPQIKVRFESFSPTRHRSDPPVTVGFVTARMRRLERRDVSVKGGDRPRFVPTSVLRRPETPVPEDGLFAVQADSREYSESGSPSGAYASPVEEG